MIIIIIFELDIHINSIINDIVRYTLIEKQ